MIELSVNEVANAVRGTITPGSRGESHVVGDCQIDSRKVRPGDLFIAIRGENHDGHDHIAAALAAGAVVAISEVDGEGARSVVTDTVAALGDLAQQPGNGAGQSFDQCAGERSLRWQGKQT